MPKLFALIHTGSAWVNSFNELARALPNDVQPFHLVDESLLKHTIASGRLEKTTIRRLGKLVESAAEAGARAVLVTCSTIGPAVPVLRQLFEIPLLRIDEPMVEEAVRRGQRIGILATLGATLEPTSSLVRETAQRRQLERELTPRLCEGAFELLNAGNREAHDRLVTEGLLDLQTQVDVVVLAQASMARVLSQIPPETLTVPVLSSPGPAMKRAAEILANL